MADVRALLRQQRAARRIEHPHAAYTDAGKLVCVLCREHIKTEALWDGHIRNTAHRQRLQALQQQQQQTEAQDESTDQSHKRKFDFQDDDEATTPVSTDETDRASKRTRPNTLSPEPGPAPPTSNPTEVTKPPTLTRQQSFTPTAGIELAIPSRPATPADATTTPKSAGGPLRPFSQLSDQQKSQPPTSQSTFTTISAPTPTSADAPQTLQAPQVDDDLWASFEADLLATPSNKPPAAAALTGGEAVISAAPVSAAQAAAAKSHDEEQSLRRAAKDMEIEDEREEATRALETEFEVMEELEARARRLRERREALRAGRKLGGAGQGAETEAGVGQGGGMIDTPMVGGDKDDVGERVGKTSAAAAVLAALGKENAAGTTKGKVVEEEEEDEEDEDDEDEEDDWDGFRFRA